MSEARERYTLNPAVAVGSADQEMVATPYADVTADDDVDAPDKIDETVTPVGAAGGGVAEGVALISIDPVDSTTSTAVTW